MFFRLGRRAFSLATGFFALLGFVAVPLGDQTGYEHVCTALNTPEGKRATSALSELYDATKARLFGYVTEKAQSELGNGNPMNGERFSIGGTRGIIGHDEGRVGILRGAGRKDATVTQSQER